MYRCLLVLSLLLPGCGDDSGSGNNDTDGAVGNDAAQISCDATGNLALPTIPVNIGTLTASTIPSFREWYLIVNPLTEGKDTLEATLIPQPGVSCIDYWIDGQYGGRLPVTEGEQALDLDIGGLDPGVYELVLAARDSDIAFAQIVINRSHPYYVLVTNDWDDPLKEPGVTDLEEALHDNHPELKMTHFVGPYTFTDPNATAAEVATDIDWVINMRDTYGDEIGLHIHPYCHFVESTTLSCATTPSFAYTDGDPAGVTVELSIYNRQQMGILLVRAIELFEANGLGTPTSFRAGGWTAELHTLAALADYGFVVDTSGCNWSRLEEWRNAPGANLYQWNEEHWATIDELSQPYYPSENDILSSAPPVLSILEVPDNGNLADYVRDYEIIEMFDANWPGRLPLGKPTVYVTGYHPTSYSRYDDRLEAGLTHIDRYLNRTGKGPVLYETISNMALVWPVPE